MKLSSIQYLYKSLQIQAAESILDPDDNYFYRKICRWYSKTFYTPLTEVYLLDYEHVLTNYYEATMEDVPYNDLLDMTIDDHIPELAEKQDEEFDAYAKELEEEQARTLAKKGKNPAKAKDKRNKGNKQQSLKEEAIEDQSPQPEDINIVFDDETPDDL